MYRQQPEQNIWTANIDNFKFFKHTSEQKNETFHNC